MKRLIIIIIILISNCAKLVNDLNVLNKDINDDLINASMSGNVEPVTNLLNQGANINYKDNNGKTALIYALEKGHEEIVKLLINKGANVNNKDNNGKTALMYASYYGRKEIVELLLGKGANINDKDNNGITALMYASEKGHMEIIKILIDKESNVSERNNDGKTALIYVSEKILNSEGEDKYKYMGIFFSLIKAIEYEYIKVFIPLNKSQNVIQEYKDDLKRRIGVLHYFHEKWPNLPNDLVTKILGEVCDKNEKEIFTYPEKKKKFS